MKLTFVTDELPFPPIHGGRVDAWRRLQAFASEGVKIQLIFWHAEDDVPAQETLNELNSVCDSVLGFPITRAWSARLRALAKLVSQSLYVSTRSLNAQQMRMLEEEFRRFSPDAVWVDGLFPGKIALYLAERFQKPLFNRSRNIEFQYRQKQYERALGLRNKTAAWMAKSHVESLELELLNRAEMTWDISLDDLEYWRKRGIKKISWLPVFVSQSLINELQKMSQTEPEFDLVYLGNLFTPNNIEGLSWFLQNVFPLVRAKKRARFLLSGVNPHPKIRQISNIEGVTLLPDAPSVAEVYAQGRVLINPILAGSGMNVKSVEMLFSGKPVVTCPQGVAGLPNEIRAYFKVAETAEQFADFCLSALEDKSELPIKRDLSVFTFQAIKPVISTMQSLITRAAK